MLGNSIRVVLATAKGQDRANVYFPREHIAPHTPSDNQHWVDLYTELLIDVEPNNYKPIDLSLDYVKMFQRPGTIIALYGISDQTVRNA